MLTTFCHLAALRSSLALLYKVLYPICVLFLFGLAALLVVLRIFPSDSRKWRTKAYREDLSV